MSRRYTLEYQKTCLTDSPDFTGTEAFETKIPLCWHTTKTRRKKKENAAVINVFLAYAEIQLLITINLK